MKLLAVDTALGACSAAAMDGDKILALRFEAMERGHAERLAPMVEAAVPTLEAVVDAGHDVVLVVTRPDRRRGRGSEITPSPVKSAALRLDLSVTHRLADLSDVDADRAVVVAYGAIIPEALLEKLPMLNVHFSLLPRWRGAAFVRAAGGTPRATRCPES